MFGIIYEIVKNVTIFLVLVNVVMNLFGNKEYLKYVSLFVGMVLILIVVHPFLTWLGGEDILSSKIEMSGFATDNLEWEGKMRMAEENGKKKILEGYKAQIQEQVKWLLSERSLHLRKMTITMEEEEDSKEYGKITAIYVTAGRTEEERQSDPISIDRIRITKEGEVEEYDVEENVSSELLSDEIRKELAVLYRMELGNVHIRILN